LDQTGARRKLKTQLALPIALLDEQRLKASVESL